MYSIGRELAGYTKMPFRVESFRDVCSDSISFTMSFERLVGYILSVTSQKRSAVERAEQNLN